MLFLSLPSPLRSKRHIPVSQCALKSALFFPVPYLTSFVFLVNPFSAGGGGGWDHHGWRDGRGVRCGDWCALLAFPGMPLSLLLGQEHQARAQESLRSVLTQVISLEVFRLSFLTRETRESELMQLKALKVFRKERGEGSRGVYVVHCIKSWWWYWSWLHIRKIVYLNLARKHLHAKKAFGRIKR